MVFFQVFDIVRGFKALKQMFKLNYKLSQYEKVFYDRGLS